MSTTETARMGEPVEAKSKKETLDELDQSISTIEAELIKLSAKTVTAEKEGYFEKCKEALIKAKEREIQEQALQKQIFQQAFGKISQLFTKVQDVVKLSDTEEKEWKESCAAVIIAEVKKVDQKRGDLLANRDALLVAKRSILATFNDDGPIAEVEAPNDTIARLTKANEKLMKEHKELRATFARMDAEATTLNLGKSSHIEELKKKVLELETTTEEYRSKNASLISEGWETTSTLKEKEFALKTATEKVTELEKQIKDIVTEKDANDLALTVANEKISKLDKKIVAMTYVYNVGAAARLGFMEMTKRIGSIPVRGTPDLAIIEARNDAVHGGNFIADFYLLHENPSGEKNAAQIAYFRELYGMPETYSINSIEFREILSLRGTMIACRSGTEYTFSKEDDERFLQLLAECWMIWERLTREFPADKVRVAKEFGENKGVDKKWVEMEKIANKFVRLERREMNKRRLLEEY